MTRTEEIISNWCSPVVTREPRGKLYSALAEALEVVELCAKNPAELKALTTAIAKRPNTNRAYIEAGSDAFVRVCRFLFDGEPRHTISRYTVALRKADTLKVRSSDLFVYLIRSGGINALTGYNCNRSHCPHCGGKL